jgi:hypothetical protein
MQHLITSQPQNNRPHNLQFLLTTSPSTIIENGDFQIDAFKVPLQVAQIHQKAIESFSLLGENFYSEFVFLFCFSQIK